MLQKLHMHNVNKS